MKDETKIQIEVVEQQSDGKNAEQKEIVATIEFLNMTATLDSDLKWTCPDKEWKKRIQELAGIQHGLGYVPNLWEGEARYIADAVSGKVTQFVEMEYAEDKDGVAY